MVVQPVKLECSTGVEQRFMATESAPLLFSNVIGLSLFDAIVRCLKDWNEKTHYDESYCN